MFTFNPHIYPWKAVLSPFPFTGDKTRPLDQTAGTIQSLVILLPSRKIFSSPEVCWSNTVCEGQAQQTGELMPPLPFHFFPCISIPTQTPNIIITSHHFPHELLQDVPHATKGWGLSERWEGIMVCFRQAGWKRRQRGSEKIFRWIEMRS